MTTTIQPEASRVTTPALMTAEELLTYPEMDKRVELVRGRLVVREPPGMRHGECELRIAVALSIFLTADQAARSATQTLGRVMVGDPGFTLSRNPDTVRAPDIAYVSREQFDGPMPHGFGEFAPDLAVEIRSPTDRLGAVLAKVGAWLTAGLQLVWVVDPMHQVVTVYRADGSQALLGVHDALPGEDLLPGFSLSLEELFAE